MNILEQLAEAARKRTAEHEKQVSEKELAERARALPGKGDLFLEALRRPGLSFICECKKASPSRGLISPDFPYLDIAGDYEAGGADCISVLTEPAWFLGEDRYLKEIAEQVSIPCLRKDFTVSPYMIHEAKCLGAAAVLLIVSILEQDQLKACLRTAEELGLAALTEAHTADEIRRAIDAGAAVIGVNNRNLTDFSVDTENSRKLRELVPPGILFVSESGIRTPDDIDRIVETGADAVLIGEALMRDKDRTGFLRRLRKRGMRNT